MRIHCLVMGLVLAILCGPWVATEAAPAIRVAQVMAQDTAVTVYLDIRDGDGHAVTGVTGEQLSATIGAHPATVNELVPVSDTSEGIAYIFLVDVSKSLTAAQFSLLKTALGEWADGLRPVDRAALIAFGKGVRVVQDFTRDVALLKTQIATLAPTDSQTFFHQGLVTALTLGQRRDAGLPERRVIVTLTDGIDDVAGGVTADEVYAQLRESRIPLYAVGFASGRDRTKRDAGLNALGQFARRSGGSFLDASGGDLPLAYSALRQEINEQYRARLSCAECIADGTLHRLQLVLRQDTAVVSTDLDVRLLAARDTAAEPKVPAGDSTAAREDKAPAPADAESPEGGASTGAGTAESAGETAKPDTSAAPPEERISMLQRIPPWQWSAAVAGLLLLVLLLWLILRRRRSTAAEKAAAQAQVAAEAMRAVPHPTEAPPTLASPPTAPSLPPGPRLELTVVSGQRRGEHFGLLVNGPKEIGRAAGCALVLDNDPEVSQRHCRLRFSAPHLMIDDLASTNGTRVNGVPIAAAYALADGDLVGIGRTEFRLTWPQTPQ